MDSAFNTHSQINMLVHALHEGQTTVQQGRQFGLRRSFTVRRSVCCPMGGHIASSIFNHIITCYEFIFKYINNLFIIKIFTWLRRSTYALRSVCCPMGEQVTSCHCFHICEHTSDINTKCVIVFISNHFFFFEKQVPLQFDKGSSPDYDIQQAPIDPYVDHYPWANNRPQVIYIYIFNHIYIIIGNIL